MLAQPTQPFLKGMVIPLEGGGGGGPILFQWNPQMIKHKKTAVWAELKPIGREQPIYQYSIGSSQDISFTMDISEPGGTGASFKDYVDKFIELTKPTVGGTVKRPPKLKLLLGKTHSMECILTSVEIDYGPLYSPSTLGPLQGNITLTFNEFK